MHRMNSGGHFDAATASRRRFERRPARLALAVALALAATCSAPSAFADLDSARRALESGDFRKALSDASFEVPAQPFEAHRIRGDAFTGMAREREKETPGAGSTLFRQAVGEYQRAMARKPSDRQLIVSVAKRLREAGIPSQAADYFERAHAMDPSDYEVLKEHMELLHQLGRYGTYFETGNAALEREKDAVRARELNSRLSEVYQERTRWREAGNALQKSYDGIEPTAAQWVALGRLRQKSGEFRLAVLAYEKARALNENDHEVTYQLAESYWDSGATDDACDMYANLIRDKAPQVQLISNQPNKWRKVQIRINPLAWLLHSELGLYPFFAVVGGFFILILAFALLKLRGTRAK